MDTINNIRKVKINSEAEGVCPDPRELSVFGLSGSGMWLSSMLLSVVGVGVLVASVLDDDVVPDGLILVEEEVDEEVVDEEVEEVVDEEVEEVVDEEVEEVEVCCEDCVEVESLLVVVVDVVDIIDETIGATVNNNTNNMIAIVRLLTIMLLSTYLNHMYSTITPKDCN